MAKYVASVLWTLKDGEDFAKGRYSRGHILRFDGGVEVAASASPHVVGKWAVEAAVDPEEMFIAALANCHMLTFLHKARLAGFVVTRYADDAEGVIHVVTGRKPADASPEFVALIEPQPGAEHHRSIIRDRHEA